jgi:hypothetical protein
MVDNAKPALYNVKQCQTPEAMKKMASVIGKSQRIDSLVRQNVKLAKRSWAGELRCSDLSTLAKLTHQFRISLASREILWLNGAWYVTSGGLLRIAEDRGCKGIQILIVSKLCNSMANRWVFKATVYKTLRSKGFVGYGDADPSNTSSLIRGAEMRVAETRAVNRALRKAYGIGLCSVEELGSQPPIVPPRHGGTAVHPPNGNGSANGQPRLRDKLCILIRKYELDPNLVKRYAADFCGTESLRDAGRDLVEAFVSTVAEEAAKDRAALVCKLNSYSQPEEVKS